MHARYSQCIVVRCEYNIYIHYNTIILFIYYNIYIHIYKYWKNINNMKYAIRRKKKYDLRDNAGIFVVRCYRRCEKRSNHREVYDNMKTNVTILQQRYIIFTRKHARGQEGTRTAAGVPVSAAADGEYCRSPLGCFYRESLALFRRPAHYRLNRTRRRPFRRLRGYHHYHRHHRQPPISLPLPP